MTDELTLDSDRMLDDLAAIVAQQAKQNVVLNEHVRQLQAQLEGAGEEL